MKKKKNAIRWVSFFVLVVVGGITGYFGGYLLGKADFTGWELAGAAAAFCVAWYLQILVHEAGHLVFGLLTGYRFVSFRILGLMWVKGEGKVRLTRLPSSGIAGQCLMSPPEREDGKLPFVLYNLGGSLLNLICAALCFGLYLLSRQAPGLPVFFLFMTFAGVMTAAVNGIPLRFGAVDNDGYNALSCAQNPEALRSLWVQLRVSEQLAEGKRLKDMPAEWFCVPADGGKSDGMTAVLGVFACNRLLDEGKWEEANALMKRLLESDNGMVGLHRYLLTCDRIYCELLAGNTEAAADLLTMEQKRIMRSLKKFPSVIRTEYAYALLAEKDGEKAGKLERLFAAVAKSYPYTGDMQGERELMELVKQAAVTDGQPRE